MKFLISCYWYSLEKEQMKAHKVAWLSSQQHIMQFNLATFITHYGLDEGKSMQITAMSRKNQMKPFIVSMDQISVIIFSCGWFHKLKAAYCSNHKICLHLLISGIWSDDTCDKSTTACFLVKLLRLPFLFFSFQSIWHLTFNAIILILPEILKGLK